jgi:hypothetical protein
VEELEERLPQFDQHLKINVTGCPNSCGQHRIADIGLEGKKLKVDGRMQDAYYFCLGGAVGQHAAFARATGYRCTADEVPVATERLLRSYLNLRENAPENLRQFFARHSDEDLRNFLAGKPSCQCLVTPSRPRAPRTKELKKPELIRDGPGKDAVYESEIEIFSRCRHQAQGFSLRLGPKTSAL